MSTPINIYSQGSDQDIKELATSEMEFIEEQVALQWDKNVEERAYELETGLDHSYQNEVIPQIISSLRKIKRNKSVVDLGCGLGFLTNALYKEGHEVVGVDLSEKSVSYATDNFANILFINSSIVKFPNLLQKRYDVCIVNMVLHNTPNLTKNVTAMSSILKKNGHIIMTIPHPAHWHKKHSSVKATCDETKELSYYVSFKVRNGQKHPAEILFVYRNMSNYINTFLNLGFVLKEYFEMNHDSSCEAHIAGFVWEKIETKFM